MDMLTLFGLCFAAFAIGGGQYLEGGELASLINMPALLIVVGGTLSAVLLQTPLATFRRALAMLPWCYGHLKSYCKRVYTNSLFGIKLNEKVA